MNQIGIEPAKTYISDPVWIVCHSTFFLYLLINSVTTDCDDHDYDYNDNDDHDNDDHNHNHNDHNDHNHDDHNHDDHNHDDHNHDDHNHDYNHNNHSHHAGAHEIPAPAPASTPFPDRIACVRLAGGCAVCHSSPEARLRRKTPGQGSGHELPPVVIAPVPLTTSSLRAACSVPGYDGDDGGARQDVLRCETCVTNRMCNKCDRWWCETCVDPDQAADKVDRSLAR